MRSFLILTIGCQPAPPAPAGTPGTDGTAAYVCSYVYAFDTGDEIGEIVAQTMDCETYADSGWQIAQDDQADCEAEGLAAGATSASCTCVWEPSEDCVPGVVND